MPARCRWSWRTAAGGIFPQERYSAYKMKELGFHMRSDAIYCVPLGGCGIFGANMMLYGHKGQWIMVDCGMGFADETMPGVDILLPDPTFASSLGDKLLGIV